MSRSSARAGGSGHDAPAATPRDLLKRSRRTLADLERLAREREPLGLAASDWLISPKAIWKKSLRLERARRRYARALCELSQEFDELENAVDEMDSSMY